MTICNSVANLLFNLEKLRNTYGENVFLIEDSIKEVKYIHKQAIKMEDRLRKYLKSFERLGFTRIRK